MHPDEQPVRRELEDHKINGLNEELRIVVLDEPGQGNACHEYLVTHKDPHTKQLMQQLIRFQNGPIKEEGINGISNEVLITIVIDRLRGFQSGEFKCRENAIALTDLEEALMWLQKRTRDRLNRGVEGTNVL